MKEYEDPNYSVFSTIHQDMVDFSQQCIGADQLEWDAEGHCKGTSD